MTRKDAPADGWRHLNALLEEGQAPMRSLRELMKDPPAEIDYDVSRLLQDGYSNFVGFRAGAQALHAAAINDLHRGDMVQAMENLQALSAFSRHPARAGELSQISAGKEKGLAS